EEGAGGAGDPGDVARGDVLEVPSRKSSTASRICWAGLSITVVTAKPPMSGLARTSARSTASRAGARSRRSPVSAYAPVATTSASLGPASGSAAGDMTGQPGVDDLLLLLRGRAGQLQ